MIDPMLAEDGPIPVSSRVLRQFAGIWVVLFAALAYWKGILPEDPLLGIVFGGLALVPGLLGLWLPAAIRPVFVLLTAITFPIGLVVSHVLLGMMYYGILTPVGIFFRLIGRDALSRRFQNDVESYWCPKPQAADVRSYFRQS